MLATEETIDAMLESSGELRLSHQPRLPPGPVKVTIRAASAAGPRRGLADGITGQYDAAGGTASIWNAWR